MYVVVQQVSGKPAQAIVCEFVELTAVNGGWIDCTGVHFRQHDDTQSISLNLSTVQGIYVVKELP